MEQVKLSQNDWTRFIKKDLPKLIMKDLEQFLIFREADLQSCCYFHMRRFAAKRKWKNGEIWKVINKPWLKVLRREPDMMICYRGKPVFIIELKYFRKRSGVSKKDAGVIAAAVEHKEWAKKAFVIEVLVDPQPGMESEYDVPKYRGRLISVEVPARLREEYLEQYRTYRKPRSRLK